MYVLNYISLVFPIDPTGASPSGWRWNAERYSSSCDAYVVMFIIMTAIYGFLVKGTSVYRLFVSIRWTTPVQKNRHDTLRIEYRGDFRLLSRRKILDALFLTQYYATAADNQ